MTLEEELSSALSSILKRRHGLARFTGQNTFETYLEILTTYNFVSGRILWLDDLKRTS